MTSFMDKSLELLRHNDNILVTLSKLNDLEKSYILILLLLNYFLLNG